MKELQPLRRSKARWVSVLTAAVMASAIAACGAQPGGEPAAEGGEGGEEAATTEPAAEASPPAAGGDGLKIGALLPATGDLSSIGQPMLAVLPLMVEKVNACGGVNGADIAIIAEDDQTDPTVGAEAMTKLTEVDKVAGVVGSFASSVSGAAVDVAVRNKVMMISPGSTSPVFTERAQKGEFEGFWARTAPPDTYQAEALAKLASERGFANVSTVAINNDYGVGFEQKFITSFKETGGTVPNEASPTRYDPKATTFETEAQAALGEKPDALAAILYVETGALLLKAAYEQGLLDGVTVLLTDGVQTPEFPEQVGKTADGKYIIEGALGTVPGADGSGLADLTALIQEKLSTKPSAFVPQTWDAMALLVLAAQAAGENTGTGIQSKLREVANAPGQEVTDVCEALELVKAGTDINYQGASGNVDVDENGDVVGSYDVWTVKADGTLEVIDTVKLD